MVPPAGFVVVLRVRGVPVLPLFLRGVPVFDAVLEGGATARRGAGRAFRGSHGRCPYLGRCLASCAAIRSATSWLALRVQATQCGSWAPGAAVSPIHRALTRVGWPYPAATGEPAFMGSVGAAC